jgi:hypothetical protein
MTTNNNSDNNEKNNETTFNPKNYAFLKKEEMASQTAGMTPEQKTQFKKDCMQSFEKLQNAVENNDLQTLDSLMKNSCLSPVDFEMAQYLAAQDPKTNVAAVFLAIQIRLGSKNVSVV